MTTEAPVTYGRPAPQAIIYRSRRKNSAEVGVGKGNFVRWDAGGAAKRALASTLRRGLGRRNFVRLARFLLDQARLDVPNDIDSNGELLVQSVAASSFGAGHRLVAYDVGANVGQWSCALIRTLLRQDGKGLDLFAFEPSATVCSRLARALKEANAPGAAHAVPLAMSNKSGVGELYKPHEGAGSSSLHKDDRFRYPSEAVSLTTLDEYCETVATSRIHLLKIDAEGHDLSVLEGAHGLLDRQAIDLVQFEYNYRWIFARHYLRDAFDLFSRAGYAIGKITPEGIEFYSRWHQELETFREANYLACPHRHVRLFPSVKWWNAGG